MLYIEKGAPSREVIQEISRVKSSPEWRKIEEGDTKAIRAAFDSLPKEKIRKDLLEEQHYLCAYCMRKIKNDGLETTIEHWEPLSRNKDKALDYGNMLAVCDGGKNWEGKGKRNLCCDASKGDEAELKISPWNKWQMDRIAYDKDGFIKTKPEDEILDRELNEKLCLNGIWKNGRFLADTSTELVKGRKDRYESVKRLITKWGKEGKCTSARIKRKIEDMEKDDHREEYAGVSLYLLKKKYQELLKRGL